MDLLLVDLRVQNAPRVRCSGVSLDIDRSRQFIHLNTGEVRSIGKEEMRKADEKFFPRAEGVFRDGHDELADADPDLVGHHDRDVSQGDFSPRFEVSHPPGLKIEVFHRIGEQHERGPSDNPLSKLFASLDQRIAVSISCAAGRGGARGERPVRVRLDDFDGGVFLAEDLTGDLSEGRRISLAHVADTVVDADFTFRRNLDLCNRRIRQPPAIPHGIEDGGDPDASFSERACPAFPFLPFLPQGMLLNFVQAGHDAR
ncbi:MAG: hypothetical protein A4E72_02444 [Syntrophus sp. PtaU1.Bin208]|nr:MAG: hypothetical protein A4E72_02444 [Syntrophus sp. PtaU1.Bin208]